MAAGSGVAWQSPSFSSDGADPGRAHFADLPFERIDLLTGNLRLVFTDLVLPGPNGMDLRVERSFSRARPTWRLGLAGYPLWIVDPDGFFYPETGVMRHPRAVTYDHVEHRLYPIDSLHSSTVWVTEKFWTSRPAGRTVHLPNGWRLQFQSPDLPALARLQFVEDPFGNRLEVDWSAAPGDALHVVEARQIPSGHPAETRTVTWSYAPHVTMTYAGRVWSYPNGFAQAV